MNENKKISIKAEMDFGVLSSSLRLAIINAMNDKNVGMISFLPSGATSDYDLPRVYAFTNNPTDEYDPKPTAIEIAGVINRKNTLYLLLDTGLINDGLIDMLEEHTHFTKQHILLNPIKTMVSPETIYYCYNDMMLQLCKTTLMALELLKEPLTENIHIADVP